MLILEISVGICSIFSLFLSIIVFLYTRRDNRRKDELEQHSTIEQLTTSAWTLDDRLKLESRLSKLEKMHETLDDFMSDLLLQELSKRKERS